jgi:hypothetical protein
MVRLLRTFVKSGQAAPPGCPPALPRRARAPRSAGRLTCLAACAAPLIAHGQLRVDALKDLRPGGSAISFPVVSGSNAAVAQRINTWLQASQLRKLPGRYRKEAFEDIVPAKENGLGVTSLDFGVSANTRAYLSLSVSGIYQSASIQEFGFEYNFDARSGAPLSLSDLFTQQGLVRLTAQVRAARLAKIDSYLDGMARPASVTGVASAAGGNEEPAPAEDTRRMYESCRTRVAADALDDMDFSLTKTALRLSRDCASSHYEAALAGNGPLVTEHAFQKLPGMLSDYGRCLLVEQRSDCVNPRRDAPRGVLHGSMGDSRIPITVVLGAPTEDGYFYDKYGRFIALQTRFAADGALHMHESADGGAAEFVLKRQPDGSFKGNWTQAKTGKALTVELR